MKRFFIIITSLFIACLHAQSTIDEDSVMSTFPEYTLAQTEINNRQKELTDTFELMVKAYEDLTHRIVPGEIKSDTALYRLYIIELEQDLNKAQKALDDYGVYASMAIEKLEIKWFELLKTKLKNNVESFCKQHQLTSMFGQSSMIYCPTCKDYTNELIIFIRDGNK